MEKGIRLEREIIVVNTSMGSASFLSNFIRAKLIGILRSRDTHRVCHYMDAPKLTDHSS